MVKRKRSRESDLEQKLTEARKEIFRALKGAKGLERQRYSKRQRDDKSSPDKIKRIEREILVLKSLDLQQTADAHLNASILKVKQLAENPGLPESIKQGVPKPELSEEEKAALHNVTSGLFNRVHVREAVDKAIRAVCLVLNVPIPDKKRKGKKGAEVEAEVKTEKEDEPREAKKAKTDDARDISTKKTPKVEEEENPFDEMDDEIPTDSDGENDAEDAVEEHDSDEEVEEKALEKMEAMLGGSDEEESGDEDMKAKYKALLGEVGDGDSADDESNSDEEEEDDDEDKDVEDEDEAMDSDRERRINAANVSLSPSPPPSRKKKEARAKKPTGKSGQTTFLPSLMGGYLSNSESEASDLDMAPPKKRLGQKQRQAIWEKKFGQKANHVKKQQQQQKARDNGWDMRKGAIDSADGKAGNKPWKKGVSDPLGRQDRGNQGPQATRETKPPLKRDDEGPLHPTWEAKKKAKEAQATATFAGTKITF
ncbi:cellular morphogenesis protein [Colletotrichum karsti]|uniref:Cellular morphogenesis protein n=1 Tax=Colletotrichum karsti TaxID=1095194 RepID=A0A9P6I6F5_9PEZI|nr:cellular morphogenesis protein [Colletotrichum karsti]KAF9875951.1 cellular morphogenesis protein [Colletotrichum karsti]